MWDIQQTSLIAALCDGEEIIIGGDGKAHTAKYGTYTIMELQVNKVIDIQLVQVGIII